MRQVEMLLCVAVSVFVVSAAGALQCGVPAVQPQLAELNIIGGTEAIPNSWPWQAGLYLKPIVNFFPFNHGDHFCAGALIDKRTIITAAHCLSFPPSDMRVHLGSHKRSSKDFGEVFIDVEDFCAHPGWDANMHDIGIVRLAADAPITKGISTICLPEANDEVHEDDDLYVTGWGFTSGGINRRAAEVLMQVKQHQISKEQCRRMRPINTDSLICALHTLGSSCHGDSGGPLQMKRNGRWQLQGVVSGGPPVCGTRSYPMYYTEVSKYIDWINKFQRSPQRALNNPKMCSDWH